MNNKVIVVADNHLGKFWKSNNSSFNKGRKVINNFIDNMNDIISKYKDSTLIFAGDIFDSVNANTEMLVYIKQRLNLILNKKNFKDIYAIAGNHETFIDKEGKQQTLLIIGLDNNNVCIYIDGISNKIINEVNYVFIPFQNNLEELLESSLKEHLIKEKKNILIMHMTPKEIFSYSKYSIKELINNIKENEYDMPYIILGHYHIPCETSYKGTKIISVGSSYYHTIDDLEKKDKNKRYLVINEDLSIDYNDYEKLPKIIEYDNIESQIYFDSNIVSEINNKYDTDIILYLKSKVLIDYSALVFKGYDVYFELIEDIDDNLITLNETLSNSFNDNNTDRKSLENRWEKYIESQNIDDKEKNLCTFLFNKRNDSDLKIDDLYNILCGEEENGAE